VTVLRTPSPLPGSGKTIGLIVPPSPFLLDERVFVSLGLLTVAAVLERGGYGVALLDLSGVQNYADAIAPFLASEQAAGIQTIGIQHHKRFVRHKDSTSFFRPRGLSHVTTPSPTAYAVGCILSPLRG